MLSLGQIYQRVYFTSAIDTSPPGTLLYLDCEEVSDGELLLSWGWQERNDETHSRGKGNTITHSVVDYREGQVWKRVEDVVKHSPFTLYCKFSLYCKLSNNAQLILVQERSIPAIQIPGGNHTD